MHPLVLAVALARAIAISPPHPAPSIMPDAVLTNGGIACAFTTQQELRRSAGRNPKALHLVMCLDGHDGSVVGAMLRKSGAIYCDVNGAVDFGTSCAVMNGCGLVNDVVCG